VSAKIIGFPASANVRFDSRAYYFATVAGARDARTMPARNPLSGPCPLCAWHHRKHHPKCFITSLLPQRKQP
jgi:hypothetical protein